MAAKVWLNCKMCVGSWARLERYYPLTEYEPKLTVFVLSCFVGEWESGNSLMQRWQLSEIRRNGGTRRPLSEGYEGASRVLSDLSGLTMWVELFTHSRSHVTSPASYSAHENASHIEPSAHVAGPVASTVVPLDILPRV